MENNSNKYLFIDFDGVINDNYSEVKESCINILKEILASSGAKPVVISSWLGWGSDRSINHVKEFLASFDITNIDYIDVNYEGTLNGYYIAPRILGIYKYLEDKEKSLYLILDDDYKNDYKSAKLNFYHTDPDKGLIEEDLPKLKFKKYKNTISNEISLKHYNRAIGDDIMGFMGYVRTRK